MRSITKLELFEAIKRYKDKKVVVTFHTIGDRDAVGSAVALAGYFTSATVITPDFITNNAKRMLTFLGYEDKIKTTFPDDTEVIIVVDANNLFALGKLQEKVKKFSGETLFIDHHAPHDDLPLDAFVFNDESYEATASVVYEALQSIGAEITREIAILILNGIVADSADLQNANSETFSQISKLLDAAKIGYSFFTEYFRTSVPVKSKYQVVKDIAAAQAEIVGKYLIMYGRAEEHANVVADAALKLDADVAVFWVSGRTEGSISARLRAPLEKELPLHLGVLMSDIGPILGGNGGGHAGAAGAYGPKIGAAQAAGEQVVRRIIAKMKESQGMLA